MSNPDRYNRAILNLEREELGVMARERSPCKTEKGVCTRSEMVLDGGESASV